jgi:hypothetical protein
MQDTRCKLQATRRKLSHSCIVQHEFCIVQLKSLTIKKGSRMGITTPHIPWNARDILLPSALRLDIALQKYVDPAGRVDYGALGNEASVRERSKELEACNLSALYTREEKLTFWINTYNLLVIVGVLDELRRNPSYQGVLGGDAWALWPPRRIAELLGAWRFFYRRVYVVGGQPLTLADLEHRILRDELKEPRIHFALVCAADSCPPLRRGLYSTDTIHEELDTATRNFIRSPKGSYIERETHTVWLSPIFEWYRRDFEQAMRSRVEKAALHYAMRYLTDDDLLYLKRHGAQVRLRYFKYNWTLNARRTMNSD